MVDAEVALASAIFMVIRVVGPQVGQGVSLRVSCSTVEADLGAFQDSLGMSCLD